VATDPLAIVAALVLEDGREWGAIAAPWQWDDVGAIFGNAVRRHFLTRPRGGSKTMDLGAVALAWLVTVAPAGARGYVVAVNKDQAALLVDAAAGLVDRTPALRGSVTVQSLRLVARSGASVTVLAADGPAAFGLRPSLLIVDEFAQWPETRNPKLLWSALVSATHKVPGCKLVVLTSAGEPGHFSSGVLDIAKAHPEEWRVNEIPGPLPWVDPADLDAQRRLLTPSAFARLHLNQWTAAEDRLVSADDLRACTLHESVLDPVPGVSYVAGLDIGLKKDRTVLSVCHAEEGESGRMIVLDRQIVWQGTRTRPVDLGDVEATCIHVTDTYARCRFVVDPWQAAQLAQRLRHRRISVVEFTFGQQSVGRLAQRLYNLLREHSLALPGDDAELLDELANVRIRETSPGVFRMDHDADRHDDRAISLALAANELLESGGRRHARMTHAGLSRSLVGALNGGQIR